MPGQLSGSYKSRADFLKEVFPEIAGPGSDEEVLRRAIRFVDADDSFTPDEKAELRQMVQAPVKGARPTSAWSTFGKAAGDATLSGIPSLFGFDDNIGLALSDDERREHPIARGMGELTGTIASFALPGAILGKGLKAAAGVSKAGKLATSGAKLNTISKLSEPLTTMKKGKEVTTALKSASPLSGWEKTLAKTHRLGGPGIVYGTATAVPRGMASERHQQKDAAASLDPMFGDRPTEDQQWGHQLASGALETGMSALALGPVTAAVGPFKAALGQLGGAVASMANSATGAGADPTAYMNPLTLALPAGLAGLGWRGSRHYKDAASTTLPPGTPRGPKGDPLDARLDALYKERRGITEKAARAAERKDARATARQSPQQAAVAAAVNGTPPPATDASSLSRAYIGAVTDPSVREAHKRAHLQYATRKAKGVVEDVRDEPWTLGLIGRSATGEHYAITGPNHLTVLDGPRAKQPFFGQPQENDALMLRSPEGAILDVPPGLAKNFKWAGYGHIEMGNGLRGVAHNPEYTEILGYLPGETTLRRLSQADLNEEQQGVLLHWMQGSEKPREQVNWEALVGLPSAEEAMRSAKGDADAVRAMIYARFGIDIGPQPPRNTGGTPDVPSSPNGRPRTPSGNGNPPPNTPPSWTPEVPDPETLGLPMPDPADTLDSWLSSIDNMLGAQGLDALDAAEAKFGGRAGLEAYFNALKVRAGVNARGRAPAAGAPSGGPREFGSTPEGEAEMDARIRGR